MRYRKVVDTEDTVVADTSEDFAVLAFVVAGTFAEDFAVLASDRVAAAVLASDRVAAAVLASDRVVADNTEEEDTDMVPAVSDTAALV
jgi:hypothetical protein